MEFRDDIEYVLSTLLLLSISHVYNRYDYLAETGLLATISESNIKSFRKLRLKA